MADNTIAFDDFLCARLRCCTQCGQPLVAHQSMLVTLTLRARCIGVAHCQPCRRRDPDMTKLAALLRQRYVKEQF
jgi:hypothetical protein